MLRPVTKPAGPLTRDEWQGKELLLSDGSIVTGWRDAADNYYERRSSPGGFQWFLLETPAGDDDDLPF